MTTITTETYKGHTITLHYDDSGCGNPRDDDNGTLLSLSHRRYSLPNEAGVPFDDLDSWDEVEAWLRANFDVVGLLPVSMTDHSGCTYYVGAPRDPWDSGRVGFIIMTREGQAEMGTPDNLVDELLEGDVKVFGQWAAGEVYGYTVEDGNGDEIDACWGFVGYDDTDDIIQQGRDAVEANLRHLDREIDHWASLA